MRINIELSIVLNVPYVRCEYMCGLIYLIAIYAAK